MVSLCIVHVIFSSRIAGGEHHCIDLANAQAALGHEVHVIGPARSAVRGVLSPAIRFHGIALPLLRGWRVRQISRRLGADVVHGHLGPACKATAWADSGARMGTLHVGFKRHQHAKLDGLVCVNARQPAALAAYDGLHRVIHNWAPDRSHKTGSETPRVSLREELRIPATAPVIGCIGRLHATKGMDLLIPAFRRHAPADAHLVLLGEGPQREELQKLSENDPRIHLMGFRWDIDLLLADMDLYVSASREEAFPLVILEAMRAGLPVLATATDGGKEMLSEQVGCRIVPIGDAEALGLALARMVADGARGGQTRIAYPLDRFDRSTAVQATLALYRDVIARRESHADARELANADGHYDTHYDAQLAEDAGR